jgi:hypothetical protein
MRSLSPALLLLICCQSTTQSHEPEDLQSALEARGRAAAALLTDHDMGALKAMASATAQPYFEALEQSLAFDNDIYGDSLSWQAASPALEARHRHKYTFLSASLDGLAGVALLVCRRQGKTEALRASFRLEAGRWCIDGFAQEPGAAATSFADMVDGAREQLSWMQENWHPQVGPLGRAFLQAARDRDTEAMRRCMTSDCWEAWRSGSSLGKGLLSGELALVGWGWSPRGEDSQGFLAYVQDTEGDVNVVDLHIRGERWLPPLWRITAIN